MFVPAMLFGRDHPFSLGAKQKSESQPSLPQLSAADEQ
jgi:hypothetical protein